MFNLEKFSTHDGSLCVGGVSVIDLSNMQGTPFYVYDLEIIRQNYSLLRTQLIDRFDIFFAVKANPSLAICSLMNSLGAGAEVVSEGEISVALATGFPPERVIFNGPGKTDQAILKGIDAGIGLFNVESITDLKRIEQHARSAGRCVNVCIRINPTFGSSDACISTGGGAQKFGTDEEQIDELVRASMNSAFIELKGIHIFEGSQVMESQQLVASMRNTVGLARKLADQYNLPFTDINLGGGIGVGYGHNSSEFDLGSFCQSLNSLAVEEASNIRFILELGRYLVADSGVYVAKVLDVKESQGQHYVITDGGINHAMLPITKNQYPILLVNRVDEASTVPSYIGGPLCTSADLTTEAISLPNAKPGDLVGMFMAGAYGFSASMLNFLSFPMPAELVVDNSRASVARDRGDVDDFLRNQHLYK